MPVSVKIQRLYEQADATDGYRVFVDRLWPRGVSKDEFKFDLWCKDLASSFDLRKWFDHKIQNWSGFSERYRTELRTPEQQQRIHNVLKEADGQPVILLYGARDPEHNHAVVLAQEFQHTVSAHHK